MANKYLKGGALNPAWCDEQDAALEAERIKSSLEAIYDAFDDSDINLNLRLGDGIGVSILKSMKQQYGEVNATTESLSDYEAKFEFLKRHSSTPEDLELAKDILGLI